MVFNFCTLYKFHLEKILLLRFMRFVEFLRIYSIPPALVNA
jgi:hypothetical protein